MIDGIVQELETKILSAKVVLVALVIGLLVGLMGGLAFGWKFWSPKPAKVETPAAAMRQVDGSLVLERKPDAEAKPQQAIPAGATVERVVQVTVQPRRPGPSGEATAATSGSVPQVEGLPARPTATAPASVAPCPPCPPVRVDLSLIRLADQTRRVIASSPDGTVVGGIDMPVTVAQEPRRLVWAAGGSWNPKDKTWGAWVDRDVAFLRVGAEVFQTRADLTGRISWAGQIRGGVRF